MRALRDRLLALIEDLVERTPVERLARVSSESRDDGWTLQGIAARLRVKDLT